MASVPQHQQQQQQQQQVSPPQPPQPLAQPMLPQQQAAQQASQQTQMQQSQQQAQPIRQPSQQTVQEGAIGLPLPPPRRSAPNAPINKPPTASPPANVGKHNKTERRYRQKVQQAQADLRDSVPALRVLYGTSSEEQKQSTDIRAPDGTVDGLGEVTRPNASAKATILIGARMYIELLQRRTAMLQRKVAELETWRAVVSGQSELDAWRLDFENREAVIAAQLAAAAQQAASLDSDGGESEEEEEEAPTRKRARTTKKTKADSKMGTGMRAFAAFAVSFSLMPSASKMFKSQPAPSVGSSAATYAGEMSRGHVIGRLPLITAEHSSRLLARALPPALVPNAHTIVDWSVRLFVTMGLLVLLGPLLERAAKRYQDKNTGAGNIMGLCRDTFHLYVGSHLQAAAEWTSLAARIVGGGEL